MQTKKLAEIKNYIIKQNYPTYDFTESTSETNSSANVSNQEINELFEVDKDFPYKEITLSPKLNNILIEDYYNVHVLNKFPIKTDEINWNFTINEIFSQYLKTKVSKFNIAKKFNKSNTSIKLLNCKEQELFKNIELELQIIYIQDIVASLKGFMKMRLNSILYNEQELEFTLNFLNSKNENLLSILGHVHLLRFIIQTPYLIKMFYNNDFTKDENRRNYQIFVCVIEDFLNWLEKVI